MSDDAERIRQQMQNLRREVGADVHDIVHSARQLSDWRYYVKHFPWACVGSAFALGFFVSPARKKLMPGGVDAKSLLAHLKAQGLNVTPGRAAGFAPGGMAGRLIGLAGPFVMRQASEMIKQRLRAQNGADLRTPAATREAPGSP